MLIKYIGRYGNVDDAIRQNHTGLYLRQDNWDDFTYKTYFQTTFIVDGEEVEIGSVRILIEGQKTSYSFLNQLIETDVWDGVFPIPGINYISVPSELEFYKIIEGKLGKDLALEAANMLRDAGYMINVMRDDSSIRLKETEGFSTSLQRETGSIKAFEDGWRFLERLEINIEDFSFTFSLHHLQNPVAISFNLNSEILPYDINILVGPNGIGKSQALQKLVESLLKIERCTEIKLHELRIAPFSSWPKVSQIIVISYSPFEQFILDIEKYDIRDKTIYKYFGFRKKRTTEGGRSTIGISRNRPAQDSVDSLAKCIEADEKFGYLADWVNKVGTANLILKEAIDFEVLAVELSDETSTDDIYKDVIFSPTPIIGSERKKYLPISDHNKHNINVEAIDKCVNRIRGVVFLKNDNVVELSSGQRLFSYIVINILGAIRNNSLILIDEPELFLHPNLEVSYISLLKSVLHYFASKAIIATHSLIAVREVPKKCVHVITRTDNGTIAVNPPFETFGGDIQRISSYVFGDKSVTKPYEEWLRNKVLELGSPENVIAALGNEINEETIMYLKGMEN